MRRRLIISYIALAVLLLLVLEVPLGIVAAKRERSQAADSAERQAEALAVSVSTPLASGNISDLAATARMYRMQTGGEVAVADRDGHVVASSYPDGDGDRGPDTADETRDALAGRPTYSFGRDEGEAWATAAVPVYNGTAVVGSVEVGIPATATETRVHEIWLALAVVGGALLILAGAVGLLMARWLSRPLNRLGQAAASFAAGRLDTRAEPAGPPEVRAVATEFNRMGAHLQELLGAQSRFVAEASHQLRSPLTALRLRMENLESDLEGEHAAELAAARREIARLSRIVDGLLTLGRAERDTPPTVEVGVAEVVRERCDAWSALAEESGVDLSAVVEVSGPGRAALVGGDLEQVLDNLIANAIDAMPDGGALTVSLSGAESGPWELHVTDQGPGMSEEDRSRAFDRFWQGAGPKASGRSGLGLAIVRQLVVRNGASVRLFAAEPHGIDAVVVFPADLVVRLGGRVARERDGKEITKVG